jgi:uncharacterized membrane protein YccC
MAFALAVPLIWGVQTGHAGPAEWIALTAECICWVALKGTYGQRLRVLAGGIFLALFFAVVGNLAGGHIVLSIIAMLGVAFLAGLFKNLGDRGSGLSICVYLMFLLNNAHPVYGQELLNRCAWILLGGAWNAVLGIATFILMPVQQPYRRTIAVIWRANSTLLQSIGKGWDGKDIRSSQRQIYQNEKAVRVAIDNSFLFHEEMAHQLRREKDPQEYELAQVRKAAALVATHASAINDELESIKLQQIAEGLRLKIYEVIKSLSQTTERMAVYVLSRRSEEELLVRARLQKLGNALQILKEHQEALPLEISRVIRRTIQLTERSIRLIERSIERVGSVAEARAFQSYSLVRTIMILHPRHWLRNLRLLFNTNTLTARYAIRTAIAAGVAVAIWKYFDIYRGYWLAFTVIIVLQPYFGATFQKAVDRIIGTVLGGIAGGLFLMLPAGLYLKEILLFISAVAMMYFFRSRYSIASFFITLNLVLLFSVSEELNRYLLLIRAGSTLGGAAIAVIAGYVLFPAWDKKWLPRHLAAALHKNYDYFLATFCPPQAGTVWTRYKRQAETENSNAFDSFSRYMQEPHTERKSHSTYYQFITHNVRVTRELNNIHIEQEGKEEADRNRPATTEQLALLHKSLALFNTVVQSIPALYQKEVVDVVNDFPKDNQAFHLTAPQIIYLEKMNADLKSMQRNLEELLH